MTQQLWQASKLATMGELAASVAHELNNPLTSVIGFSDLLLTEDLISGYDANAAVAEFRPEIVDHHAATMTVLAGFGHREHVHLTWLAVRALTLGGLGIAVLT